MNSHENINIRYIKPIQEVDQLIVDNPEINCLDIDSLYHTTAEKGGLSIYVNASMSYTLLSINHPIDLYYLDKLIYSLVLKHCYLPEVIKFKNYYFKRFDHHVFHVGKYKLFNPNEND